MAKQRYINTKFWSDPFIQNLDKDTKLFYLYLMTNEHNNIAGIYEISLKTIIFETGLNVKEVSNSMNTLSKARKVHFIDGYIILCNFPKHQDWQKSPKIKQGIDARLSEIPKSIVEKIYTLSIPYAYPLNYSNSNSNSNNTVPPKVGTITLNGETMNYEELTYEPLEGSKKKSVLGRKTMFILVHAYLDAKGIKLTPDEQYDANKVSKGISKLYNECKKDPNETIRRIRLGAEYFKSKELDWTPEAVWRRWEDIKQWDDKKFNSDLYE